MRLGIAFARLSRSGGTILGGTCGCSEPKRKPRDSFVRAVAAQPSACRDDVEADNSPRAAQAGGRGGSGERQFRLGEALAYMANMRTFWMITVGLGEPALLPRLPCVLAPCRIESSSVLATHGLGHPRIAALEFLTALG